MRKSDWSSYPKGLPIEALKGVGPSLSAKLSRIGINTAEDLLFHLPFRYEDRTTVSTIASVTAGSSYLLEGIISETKIIFGRRRSLLAFLEDNTGRIGLRFYYFSKSQQAKLDSKKKIRCYGEARKGASGLEIYHPEYANIDIDTSPNEHLTPIYPLTEGITQSRYRKIVAEALLYLKKVPIQNLINRKSGIDISEAIQYLHKPPPGANADLLMQGEHPAQKTLSLDELTAHQTYSRLIRDELKKLKAPGHSNPGSKYKKAIRSLGFKLTGAQSRVAKEISNDMMQKHPMLRLIQGDVGSGKTVLAALAAIHTHENGLQSAVMAPTELLAEQHFYTLSAWLEPLKIEVSLLTGNVKGKTRKIQIERIKDGKTNVIIGTHALFQREIIFQSLGIVIIDEQHRFGVHQRLALREKGAKKNFAPHQMIMTATPIPRTLSMGIYAEMDVSTIDELPPGRKPISTSVLSNDKRSEVIAKVDAACQSGRQAYWVCTLIAESEHLECEAAEKVAAELQDRLPKISIALVHGKLSSDAKAKIMDEFKKGSVDLLVSTTVIEVGVDVPNASLMIIENSERLGLAQLHQLRGRVGRGSNVSHCLLLYKQPLGELSRQRLTVMRESNDGFFIAERDLEIRGPGEIFGTKQSGEIRLKIADFLRDKEMLPEAREIAEKLLIEDRETAKILIRRWITNTEDVGLV